MEKEKTKPRINWLTVALKAFVLLVLFIPSLWAAAAIYYSNLPGAVLRAAAAVFFLAFYIGIFICIRSLIKILRIYAGVFAVVLVWWLLIPPSNERDWQADVSVLPYAEINGNLITVHNIRDFEYDCSGGQTVHYYDKTFALDKLVGADIYTDFWGPTLICHTITSFGFEGGDHLAISIETRKEKTEDYSAVRGFFKQYELTYVVADEHDVLSVRAVCRNEDLYLYRLNTRPELLRNVLLDYFKTINSLRDTPRWYNALTHNCTTSIRGHTKHYARGKFSWKIIVNGYLDTLFYERGIINTDMPLDELRRKCYISDTIRNMDSREHFSRKIREGVPEPGRTDTEVPKEAQ